MIKDFNCAQLIIVLLFAYIGAVYFSMAIPNILLGLLIAVFVYGIIYHKIQLDFNNQNWYLFGLVIVPFILTVISMLYSENYVKGLKYVWLRMPILVAPFIVIFMKTRIKDIKQGLTIFSVLTIVASLKTIYNAFRYINEDVLFVPDFTFLITVIQHPYFGVFVLIAMVSIIEFQLIKVKFIRIAVYILFTVVIILATSRLVYILFLFLIGLYSLKYFSKRKSIILILLLISISGSLILSNNALKSKFQASYFYQNSPRLKLWNNSYKLLKTSNKALFGIGIGDYYTNNKDVYFFRETDKGELGYNPHSQIVEFVLTNGLFGVFIWATILIMLGKTIMKQNRFAKITFGIIIMFSFTECILTRQYGVQLYSIFLPLIFKENFKLKR